MQGTEHGQAGIREAARRCAFCAAQVVLSRKSSSTSWIVFLAVVCACFLFCGGVVALLLPAVSAAKATAGRRDMCANNLKQIALALLDYRSVYGHFPPASNGTLSQPVSWRVVILPFLEQNDLYLQIKANGAWNSANNLALVKRMPRVFHCPSDSTAGEGETSYVMITGENTIGGTPGSGGVSPRQVTGEASKTILVLEVHGLKIPWTEPRDITLEELIERMRTSAGRIGHVSGFSVGTADGAVRQLSNQTDAETLRQLALINGNKPVRIDSD